MWFISENMLKTCFIPLETKNINWIKCKFVINEKKVYTSASKSPEWIFIKLNN
jgi:hypothetical protein